MQYCDFLNPLPDLVIRFIYNVSCVSSTKKMHILNRPKKVFSLQNTAKYISYVSFVTVERLNMKAISSCLRCQNHLDIHHSLFSKNSNLFVGFCSTFVRFRRGGRSLAQPPEFACLKKGKHPSF